MKPIFADTSYYLALLNEEDVYHAAALAWSDRLRERIVVTEYVLVELGNALSRSKNRDRYVPLVEHLLEDVDTIFVPASTSLFRQGRQLFAARPDKEWSLVDYVSFAVMKQHRLAKALTADRHFVRAGFHALLREADTP